MRGVSCALHSAICAKSINRGIAACQHRDHRNQLQKKQNIGREEAETIMKEERLADLDVWQSCVPAPTTTRTCRAITRKITHQLETANRESKGFAYTHTHTHTHTHTMHAYAHTHTSPDCCLQIQRSRCRRSRKFRPTCATRHLRYYKHAYKHIIPKHQFLFCACVCRRNNTSWTKPN